MREWLAGVIKESETLRDTLGIGVAGAYYEGKVAAYQSVLREMDRDSQVVQTFDRMVETVISGH